MLVEILSNKIKNIRQTLGIVTDHDLVEGITTIETIFEGTKTAHGKEHLYDFGCRLAERDQPPALDPMMLLRLGSAYASGEYFRRLFMKESQETIIPLASLTGVAASKSKLSHYSSLYNFGRACYRDQRTSYLSMSEDAYFEYCLDGGYGEGGAHFYERSWCPGLIWSNSGGSHRFATACYMDEKDQRHATVSGIIKQYRLNYEWLDHVSKYFDTYLLTTDGYKSDSNLHKLFQYGELKQSAVFIHFSNTYFRLTPQKQHAVGNEYSPPAMTQLILIRRNIKLPGACKKWLQTKSYDGSIVTLEKYSAG